MELKLANVCPELDFSAIHGCWFNQQ